MKITYAGQEPSKILVKFEPPKPAIVPIPKPAPDWNCATTSDKPPIKVGPCAGIWTNHNYFGTPKFPGIYFTRIPNTNICFWSRWDDKYWYFDAAQPEIAARSLHISSDQKRDYISFR